MPIGTRLSTPIPRNYLHDERLNSITDALTREAYVRAKLVCDNLGRLPAHPAMLASTLFPAMPPTAAEMSRIIGVWVKAGLAFHYQAGSRWYVEIADNGETSKLVGNMTGESEYPAPPTKMITEWKAKFFCDWKPIQRKSKRVHTRSNECDTRSPEEKRREGKRSEGSGAVSSTSDAARRTANAPTGRTGTLPERLKEKIKRDDGETAKQFLDGLKVESEESYKRLIEAARRTGFQFPVDDGTIGPSFLITMLEVFEDQESSLDAGDLTPGNYCSKIIDACMKARPKIPYSPSFAKHRDKLREQERAA
jgi:hypothetical protein